MSYSFVSARVVTKNGLKIVIIFFCVLKMLSLKRMKITFLDSVFCKTRLIVIQALRRALSKKKLRRSRFFDIAHRYILRCGFPFAFEEVVELLGLNVHLYILHSQGNFTRNLHFCENQIASGPMQWIGCFCNEEYKNI